MKNSFFHILYDKKWHNCVREQFSDRDGQIILKDASFEKGRDVF
jgi:hypothetical protein